MKRITLKTTHNFFAFGLGWKSSRDNGYQGDEYIDIIIGCLIISIKI